MQQIKLLEESVINKIAAGEVIERPASVVKELVENALDAGATQVTVSIEEGGKSRIRVVDNGHGMPKTDAQLCIQRHATSKIRNADDLFNINTLGFRGEGLASIVAVSRVTLETKTADADTGIKLVVHGGNLQSEEETVMTQGTVIDVTDLFFNVPARKKHLKTMQTELRKITELMTKYAIIFPDISFRLEHHGKELLFAPASDALSRLHFLYGKKIADALLPVDYHHDGFHVVGFIGKPTLTRADKTMQHIFVNKRPIQNYIIGKAVHDAYHTLLHLEREPVFFLNVTIEPHTIDVNVHPQKTTIRIEKENDLYNALFTAVRDVLDQAKLIPVVRETNETQTAFMNTSFSVAQEKQASFVSSAPSTSAAPSQSSTTESNAAQTPQALLDRAIEKMTGVVEDATSTAVTTQAQEAVAAQEKRQVVTTQTPRVVGNEKISTLRLIGCIHKVFYLAENELGLVVIDQHAAHERVLYEHFMKAYYDGDIPIQTLLEPVQMQFSPSDLLIVQENQQLLAKLGFTFDGFGGNTMLLRTTPTVFGNVVNENIVYDILGQLGDAKNSIDSIKEEKIIRSSCRAAVKAHDTVHEHHMKTILNQLQLCEQPFTCPHGRPTMIQFSVPELEKKFKRIV